jgi:predicted S18 family serine protease
MTKLEEKQAELIKWFGKNCKPVNTEYVDFKRYKDLVAEITQLEQSISSLQEGECYPREFVLSLTAYTQFYIDKMFEVWQSKVKS